MNAVSGTFHGFADPQELAEKTAARIASILGDALAARPTASLVVPGGRTPGPFLSRLALAGLDWERLHVCLSDERWVPPTAPESNEALLRRTLLTGDAERAHFVQLYTGGSTPKVGLEEAERRVAALPRPINVVVVGMGEDGHFASLFPGEEALAQGLREDGTASCVPAIGPGGGPPRLSLTLSRLLDARHLFLLATGEAKRALWDKAADGGPAEELPIRALRRQTKVPVEVLWCP